MEAITTADPATDTQLATVGDSDRVHLAFPWQRGAPTCDRNERVVNVLTTVTAGSGLHELVAAIVAAKIPVRRLCCHCFVVRTRKAVADARSAARATATR